MWDHNPNTRWSFEEVTHLLEDRSYWLPGTDEAAFFHYKGYLDASENIDEFGSVINPIWITRVSALREMIPQLISAGRTVVDAIVDMLVYVTVGLEDSAAVQRQELEATLRSSFDRANQIDASMFRDYAYKFLSDRFARPRKQSIFALTPLTGAIIEYEDLTIGALLWRGVLGDVYRARQKKAKRNVAVKRVTPSLNCDGCAGDDRDVSRQLCNVLREILAGIYCKHPAVVPFVGWNFLCNENPHVVIIVTEFMEGGTIAEHLDATPTQKMIYLYGVARGLCRLHSLSILHRDVKLENIFVDSEGHPRIGDLGTARLFETGEITGKMGSLEYMAPEVHEYNSRPEEDPTSWSFPADVYAYAIMLWQIMTGRRWNCTTLKKPEFKFAQEVSRRDKPLRPPVDGLTVQGHRSLLGQMWDWKPANRPTFEQIVELLEQEEYWLSGTNGAELLKYVNDLKRKESQIVVESATHCQRFLRQIESADTLADVLDEIDYDGDGDILTEKLIHSLGYVCGSGENRNTEVMESVRACLREKQWLDPVMINLAATEPLNPVEDTRPA
jgi:serine/threonine protein kinase